MSGNDKKEGLGIVVMDWDGKNGLVLWFIEFWVIGRDMSP